MRVFWSNSCYFSTAEWDKLEYRGDLSSSGTRICQQPLIYLKTFIDNITSVLLQADVSIIVHPSESQGLDRMDEQ